jgi:type II secretory ATPase GspE/PulE/Tfp pilus assembly ATPase PilB-like protein
MCRDASAALAALELIVNQRLVRRVCRACGGAGCGVCLETGYHGRTPLVEWFRADDEVRAQIREQGAAAIVPAQSLAAAGEVLVASGVTDQREIERLMGS